MKKIIIAMLLCIPLSASADISEIGKFSNVGAGATTINGSLNILGSVNGYICWAQSASGDDVTGVSSNTMGALTLYDKRASVQSPLYSYWFYLKASQIVSGNQTTTITRTGNTGNLSLACWSLSGVSATLVDSAYYGTAPGAGGTVKFHLNKRGTAYSRVSGGGNQTINLVSGAATQCALPVTGNRCVAMKTSPQTINAGNGIFTYTTTTTVTTVGFHTLAVDAAVTTCNDPTIDGMGGSVDNARSSFNDKFGFPLTQVTCWMRDKLLMPIMGTGLGTLYDLRWHILALIAVSIVVFFGFRAFGSFRN